jgi:hypothetical protein
LVKLSSFNDIRHALHELWAADALEMSGRRPAAAVDADFQV